MDKFLCELHFIRQTRAQVIFLKQQLSQFPTNLSLGLSTLFQIDAFGPTFFDCSNLLFSQTFCFMYRYQKKVMPSLSDLVSFTFAYKFGTQCIRAYRNNIRRREYDDDQNPTPARRRRLVPNYKIFRIRPEVHILISTQCANIHGQAGSELCEIPGLWPPPPGDRIGTT